MSKPRAEVELEDVVVQRVKGEGDEMNAIECVIEEAAKHGVKLSEKDADWVLWEHTGWPAFWPDREKSVEENLRMQVAEWAKETK